MTRVIHDCKICKINDFAKKEKGVCAWYMDNVVCGDKCVQDCPLFCMVESKEDKE